MPCDARPVYLAEEENGPEKGVLRDGRVVSCRFVEDPGEATALGYVPHFATCGPPREEASLYTQGNPYGYRLNLRHPLVQKLYYRYKERMGISRSTPLSDEERLDFEERVIPWLERRGNPCPENGSPGAAGSSTATAATGTSAATTAGTAP